jgi:hypothetical protein
MEISRTLDVDISFQEDRVYQGTTLGFVLMLGSYFDSNRVIDEQLILQGIAGGNG